MAVTQPQAETPRVGPYTLGERVGPGALGVVYRGTDEHGIEAAVTLLAPQLVLGDPGQENPRDRLASELYLLRQVRGAGIAEILDADVEGAHPYIARRYVSGPTLERYVRTRGPLRGRALHGLTVALAGVVSTLHEAGAAHRGLSPGNVIVTDGRPVVVDFGLAHLPGIEMGGGDPGYLAPEIIKGEQITAATDIFALAATIVFAATGHAPFDGGTVQAVYYAIMRGSVDLSEVPAPFRPLLREAMSETPELRPSAADLRRRLAGLDPVMLEGMAAMAAAPLAAPSTGDDDPAAEGRPTPTPLEFQRETPAQVKPIPVLRRRGHWGLLAGTALFVMVTASAAEFVSDLVRLAAHGAFWALVALAALVSVRRERRHDWAPAPRWPWVAAAVTGSVLVEVLAAVAGSWLVILGSLVVLSIVAVVVLMLT